MGCASLIPHAMCLSGVYDNISSTYGNRRRVKNGCKYTELPRHKKRIFNGEEQERWSWSLSTEWNSRRQRRDYWHYQT